MYADIAIHLIAFLVVITAGRMFCVSIGAFPSFEAVMSALNPPIDAPAKGFRRARLK